VAFSFPTWIGLAGAALLVLAYLLNQMQWLASSDWRFPFCNFAGAMLIAISLWFAFNLPALVIELFWMAISAYGMARALRTRAP